MRYTRDSPVLLYTDFAPDAGGGGNVIINSLLTTEERRAVIRVSPVPPADPAALGDQPYVTLKQGSSTRSGVRSWLRDMVQYGGVLADEVAALAKERNAGHVWIVLHMSGVPIAARLATRHGLAFHATVHDDPPYAIALRSKQAIAFTPWVAWAFARALRAAVTVDTISAPMAARYSRRYGVKSVVVHRGLAGPLTPRARFARKEGELTVGVLGNVYHYAQLPKLVQAVGLAAADVGVPGKVVVLGQGYGDRLRVDSLASGVNVEVLGHVPESEAVERLSGCLALYLNYPFGWRDRVLRQTSLPVKLSTYLLATRPILFHGPVGTSIEGPIAVSDGLIRHWPNCDPATGAAVLSRLWADPAADAPVGGEAVRARFYDYDTNRRNLIEALNRVPAQPTMDIGITSVKEPGK